MPEPLARDEDRAADVEAEAVVLERRAVPLAHQEADQARRRSRPGLLAPGKRDARGVDDREVVGHRPVEADEAVVEDGAVVGDRQRLRCSGLGHCGHSGQATSRAGWTGRTELTQQAAGEPSVRGPSRPVRRVTTHVSPPRDGTARQAAHVRSSTRGTTNLPHCAEGGPWRTR